MHWAPNILFEMDDGDDETMVKPLVSLVWIKHPSNGLGGTTVSAMKIFVCLQP